MPAHEPATDRTAADPLDALRGARTPRSRIAIGAAVVVFVAAVAVSAVVAFASGGGGMQGEVGAPGVRLEGVGAPGESDASPADRDPDPAPSGTLLVHVLGAVARPGIVELAPGARVVDAVGAAGGLTAEADPGGVNLARALVDGEQLVVPVVGAAPAATASGGGATADGRVSLNRADAAELDTLPRIGPALAQRIIDWREANGPFTDVAQLLDVAGIGDAVYSGLVDLVTL